MASRIGDFNSLNMVNFRYYRVNSALIFLDFKYGDSDVINNIPDLSGIKKIHIFTKEKDVSYILQLLKLIDGSLVDIKVCIGTTLENKQIYLDTLSEYVDKGDKLYLDFQYGTVDKICRFIEENENNRYLTVYFTEQGFNINVFNGANEAYIFMPFNQDNVDYTDIDGDMNNNIIEEEQL